MAALRTRKPDKRSLIIAATIELWRRAHDIGKVSLADIARKAGVSQTTIYNNFATREGLEEAVTNHIVADIMVRQQAIVDSDLPIQLKIQKMFSSKMTSVSGMQSDLLERMSTDATARQYVQKMMDARVKPMLVQLIEEAKHQGYVRADLPAEVIMLYLNILTKGGLACSEEMKQIVNDKGLLEAMAHIIYFGLFQKEFALDLNGAEKET
jgi:AcrR family transcriptional regulator